MQTSYTFSNECCMRVLCMTMRDSKTYLPNIHCQFWCSEEALELQEMVKKSVHKVWVEKNETILEIKEKYKIHTFSLIHVKLYQKQTSHGYLILLEHHLISLKIVNFKLASISHSVSFFLLRLYKTALSA